MDQQQTKLKMVMDKATAVVGIIAVSVFALPFVLDHRRRRRKNARLISALRAAATQQQCTVNRYETCNDSALGWDEKRKALFHQRDRDDAIPAQFADLSNARGCEVVLNGRMAKGHATDAPPERVELRFLPREKGGNETRLVLFQQEPGSSLNGEVQFAERWARIINEGLRR